MRYSEYQSSYGTASDAAVGAQVGGCPRDAGAAKSACGAVAPRTSLYYGHGEGYRQR